MNILFMIVITGLMLVMTTQTAFAIEKTIDYFTPFLQHVSRMKMETKGGVIICTMTGLVSHRVFHLRYNCLYLFSI